MSIGLQADDVRVEAVTEATTSVSVPYPAEVQPGDLLMARVDKKTMIFDEAVSEWVGVNREANRRKRRRKKLRR